MGSFRHCVREHFLQSVADSGAGVFPCDVAFVFHFNNRAGEGAAQFVVGFGVERVAVSGGIAFVKHFHGDIADLGLPVFPFKGLSVFFRAFRRVFRLLLRPACVFGGLGDVPQGGVAGGFSGDFADDFASDFAHFFRQSFHWFGSSWVGWWWVIRG